MSGEPSSLPDRRPPRHERTFVSPLAEAQLERSLPLIRDPELRTLFSNCWLNTLDTTIFDYDLDLYEEDHARARPRTWVITGDIAAMWLRDSSNQVMPYLSLLSSESTTSSQDWSNLYRLILGVVYSQADCILFHPFSNAFIPPSSPVRSNNGDQVHPPPPEPVEDKRGCALRVWESKWELDSLCSFFDLSAKLAQSSGRCDFLGCEQWRKAVKLALSVCRLQQRGTDEEGEILENKMTKLGKGKNEGQELGSRYEGSNGVYRFQRGTSTSSETRALSGLGEPARRCGMVKSAFRPSDDSTVLPFLVPSNCYLVAALNRLSHVIRDQPDHSSRHKIFSREDHVELAQLQTEMRTLAAEVGSAVIEHAIVKVKNDGKQEEVMAYEIDGYGGYLLADDANLPSLLSLPFIGYCSEDAPVYLTTRSLVLSPRNKWFFSSPFASGIGGMHIGLGFIWHMSIIVRAMTSDEDEEILECLAVLKSTTAGTGLMHESFWKDDARRFTRSWFAWTNGLFGQLILRLLEKSPHLLS